MRTLLIGASLSAVLLAGCGSSSTPPTTSAAGGAGPNGLAHATPAVILRQSEEALSKVKSFRLVGNMTSVGGAHRSLQLAANLYSAHAYEVSVTQNGLSLQIVLNGGTAYMQAGYQFWNHFTRNPTVSWMMRGKWFKTPESGVRAFAAAAQDFNAAHLAKCLGGSAIGLSVVGHMQVDGQPTVVLGDGHSTSDGDTVAIATNGPAYPLLIKSTSQQSSGQGNGSSVDACGSSSGGSGGQQWIGQVRLSDFNSIGHLDLPAHVIPDLHAYIRSLVGA